MMTSIRDGERSKKHEQFSKREAWKEFRSNDVERSNRHGNVGTDALTRLATSRNLASMITI
jgi:hypothetical protein